MHASQVGFWQGECLRRAASGYKVSKNLVLNICKPIIHFRSLTELLRNSALTGSSNLEPLWSYSVAATRWLPLLNVKTLSWRRKNAPRKRKRHQRAACPLEVEVPVRTLQHPRPNRRPVKSGRARWWQPVPTRKRRRSKATKQTDIFLRFGSTLSTRQLNS